MAKDTEPPHDEIADEKDQQGWDRSVHGLMAEQAAPDDAVKTEPWVPPGLEGIQWAG